MDRGVPPTSGLFWIDFNDKTNGIRRYPYPEAIFEGTEPARPPSPKGFLMQCFVLPLVSTCYPKLGFHIVFAFSLVPILIPKLYLRDRRIQWSLSPSYIWGMGRPSDPYPQAIFEGPEDPVVLIPKLYLRDGKTQRSLSPSYI